MLVRRTPRPAQFAVAALLALAAAGCCSGKGKSSGSGCTTDTDCKGDRICVDGTCQHSGGGPVQAAQQPRSNPVRPQAAPLPQAAPNPYAIAGDGLPVVIPSPSSPPPTMAEWNAVPREVTVSGSSALGCETKMLREWLRVSCRRHGSDYPLDVRTERTSGQQAYVFHTTGSVASTVVQVVRGKDYSADFTWDTGGRHWVATLHVSWPVQSARPTLYFRR